MVLTSVSASDQTIESWNSTHPLLTRDILTEIEAQFTVLQSFFSVMQVNTPLMLHQVWCGIQETIDLSGDCKQKRW